MGEEERDCSPNFALLVYKMDVQCAEAIDVDRNFVIGKLVDLCFVLPPIIMILPVLRQSLDVGQRGSIIPGRFIKLVGESSS